MTGSCGGQASHPASPSRPGPSPPPPPALPSQGRARAPPPPSPPRFRSGPGARRQQGGGAGPPPGPGRARGAGGRPGQGSRWAAPGSARHLPLPPRGAARARRAVHFALCTSRSLAQGIKAGGYSAAGRGGGGRPVPAGGSRGPGGSLALYVGASGSRACICTRMAEWLRRWT